MRPAVTGYQSEVDLRLAELRVLARDANVAGHRDLAAAAKREAVDRHHDGLAKTLYLARERLSRASFGGSGAGRRQRVELGDVGSRSEGFLSRPGDDDRADSVVALQIAQRA